MIRWTHCVSFYNSSKVTATAVVRGLEVAVTLQALEVCSVVQAVGEG